MGKTAKKERETRRYHSPRRKEQAEATRGQILEAAERLFVRDGYVGTSMSAIAKEAGVALKTVYLAFQNKSGLLRTLWHLRLRGDEKPVPVGQRPWYRAMLEEPDPNRQIRANQRNGRVVRERMGELFRVIRDSSSVDPEIARLWQTLQSEFYENQKELAKSLHRKKALKQGLGVTHAADIIWTINHPSVFLLLTGERGWTPGRVETWSADLLCRELLREPPG
jgi:AcrR family transcriptional regulator